MNLVKIEQPNYLPQIDPLIVGLPIGEVRFDGQQKPQVYFGGSKIEHLTPYDKAELRDGAISVDMYTIDGRDDVDYAEITIRTKASNRTPLEVARAMRGHGHSKIQDFVERTPVQYFISARGFLDIPLSGRARWLALDPEGNFHEGIFDDRDQTEDNPVAMFGQGWTFAWIVEGSRPFKFGELCSPRFIDENDSYPLGEAGIEELEPAILNGEFGDKIRKYTRVQSLDQVA